MIGRVVTATLLAALQGAAAGVNVDAAVGQPHTPKVRELLWNPIIPIRERLLPDDEVVELVSPFNDVVVDPSVRNVPTLIRSLTAQSDLVALVDVVEVVGVLEKNFQSCPDTKMRGAIREVLQHSTTFEAAANQPLEATALRGSVRVGSVLVRMGLHPPRDLDPLPTPATYLLFLQESDGELRVIHAPLRVVDGRLTYPWSYQRAPLKSEPLAGLKVADVAKRVRKSPRMRGPIGL